MNELEQYKQYLISTGASPQEVEQYAQYLASQQGQSAPVEQVQSPLVSAQDRLLVKNLAQSPEVGMKYLQQKNPGAQVRVQNGEIQIMSPGESSWKVVDPDTGVFSSDILSDVGDLAYDAGSGVLQSLATAAGVAGGALAGPAGAVGGGIAASGASSAALEAARQKLGQQLGLEQDVDMMDVGVAGGAGAISTGLLGGGKTKGLLQKGYEFTKGKILPKVGQMMSGVPSEAIRHYAGNTAKIDALEREGITPLIQEVTDRATGAARGYKSRTGKAVAAAIDSADEAVNVRPAKDSFLNRINALKSKPNLTNADLSEIDALEKAYTQQFMGPGMGPLMPGQNTVMSEIPDAIDANRAFDLQQRLKTLASYEQGVTPETAAMKLSARGGYSEINKGLDDVTDRVSGEAKANYRKALEADDFIDKNFETPDKTYRTLSGLDKKGRELVIERLKKYSDDGLLDISNEAKDIQAYKYFADPATTPIGMQGATSTSRTVPLALLGGTLGYYAGAQSGMGQGGAGIGAGVGAVLGSKAGSAAMIKRLIKGGMKADEAVKAVSNMGGYAPQMSIAAPLATPAVEGMMSPWMKMSADKP